MAVVLARRRARAVDTAVGPATRGNRGARSRACDIVDGFLIRHSKEKS
jgi:hypothetical protein